MAIKYNTSLCASLNQIRCFGGYLTQNRMLHLRAQAVSQQLPPGSAGCDDPLSARMRLQSK